MNDLGKPEYFDVEKYLEGVQQLVNADEILFARDAIRNVPAYYRENPTRSMTDLRTYINQRMTTEADFCVGEKETVWWGDQLYHEYQAYRRMQMVAQWVKKWNEHHRRVFIYEFGPGHYWLPYGLMRDGFNFKYRPILIDEKGTKPVYHQELAPILSEAPEFGDIVMYIAFECVEHLERDEKIRDYYDRAKIDADHIFVSTPKYTLGGGRDRKNTGMLSHIRTYAPDDLIKLVKSSWPGYLYEFYDDPQMWVHAHRPQL